MNDIQRTMAQIDLLIRVIQDLAMNAGIPIAEVIKGFRT